MKSAEFVSVGSLVITVADSFLPNQSDTVCVPNAFVPTTASFSIVLPVSLSYSLS